MTLLDAIEEHGFRAAFGGARRDEERARAKERILSFRDDFGQWDPKGQRPELWNVYNGFVKPGEHVRVFPLSNWTELDVWQYIAEEQLELPNIYFAHEREVFERDGMLYAVSDFVELLPGEEPFKKWVRFRTVGDMSCTGAVASEAKTLPRRGRRDRGHPHHRARRDARRRPRLRGRHGGPQEGGLLLAMATPGAATNGKPTATRTSELVRFATAGSVDDGKSTLIGRLLFDTKSIFEDQLEHVEETSKRRGDGYVNLALLTDGLRAEREQGITIDVAYRYFHTPRRKFIIADTPGHEQYTRNMVTGASTADLALVLVDARKGVLEQSHRHAFIASLLRIPHLVVCVNKMDLVDWDQEVFDRITADFTGWAAKLDIQDVTFIPVSALHGDNVVDRSENMPWYQGPSLLYHLEHVHVASDRNLQDARFPVQWVTRPMSDELHDYRGYAGEVASGVFRKGDEVVVLPSGRTSRIAGIDTFDGEIDEAYPPLSVTLRLEDDIDVSRGDMICRPANQPEGGQGHRRDGLLDVRAARCRRPAATASSTRAAPLWPRSTRCCTAST